MANSLFVTGSSGFIGSRFIQRLDGSKHDRIYCLCRSPSSSLGHPNNNGKLQPVRGSITDCDAYAACLTDCETVVHLAAATGKAGWDEHFEVNAKGTELFVRQCKEAGVKNFLHVSSIAVKYPDKSHYPYAQSKELGERAVRCSALNFTIVRPTIVIGQDGATWKSLVKLSKAPVLPIFGDGTTRIQPIHVDDLIDVLLMIVEKEIFRGETYELGGPEVVSFEEFLRGIHVKLFKREPRVLHIPLKPIQSTLALLEDHLSSALPISAGQLSAFSNDGTVELNGLEFQYSSTMKGVREMIDLAVAKPKETVQDQTLNAECRTFTQYLVDQDPSAFVLKKYRDAHVTGGLFNSLDSGSFDRFLLQLARQRPFATRIVDTYASLFSKSSTFRKKMILLMAVLESCAPTYAVFDEPDATGRWILLFKLMQKGLAFALVLLLSTAFLLPVQLAAKIARRGD